VKEIPTTNFDYFGGGAGVSPVSMPHATDAWPDAQRFIAAKSWGHIWKINLTYWINER